MFTIKLIEVSPLGYQICGQDAFDCFYWIYQNGQVLSVDRTNIFGLDAFDGATPKEKQEFEILEWYENAYSKTPTKFKLIK